MSEIQVDRVDLGELSLNVTTAGQGPTVVLVHGFPELAYSWRHQIRAVADAGYRVVAPDMRGYGASSRPEAVDEYDIMHLAGDLVGLIRHYGAPATVVGHDWGALIAWSLSLFRPDLLTGVVGISVPFTPIVEMSLIDIIRSNIGEGFHYILYFQEPGVAEAELEADVLDTMRRILWLASGDIATFTTTGPSERTGFLDGEVPDGLPPWLSSGDLEAYGRAFLTTGFTGALNWYRNMHRNWELTAPWRHAPVTVPAMFIGGRADPVLAATGDLDGEHPMLQLQEAYVPDLRLRLIDGAGHWTQQEKPEETSAALLDFLAEVAPVSPS